jgi:hypothetical protein
MADTRRKSTEALLRESEEIVNVFKARVEARRKADALREAEQARIDDEALESEGLLDDAIADEEEPDHA